MCHSVGYFSYSWLVCLMIYYFIKGSWTKYVEMYLENYRKNYLKMFILFP